MKKLALSLAALMALTALPAQAAPMTPTMLSQVSPAPAVQTVDSVTVGVGIGVRPYPRRYYGPRVVTRRVVRGPCRTKVVKHTRHGTVVRVRNRCW